MLDQIARAFHLPPIVFTTILISALLIIALVVGFILNRLLHQWSKQFRNSWGELAFSLFESLPLPLLLLGALYTVLELFKLPLQIERLGSKLIFALVILVIFYFPAKALILFLRRLGQGDPGFERVVQPATFLLRALFALLGVIIVLENLGISLTAVWTTLGVGSVAVALAMQDTLSNFFAGFYLVVDRPMSPGDYIKLDAGQEGFVVRIGWRSTLLRTQANNIVIVPNSTLAKAVITNYSIPELRLGLLIPVRVAYGTDARRVEEILLEVVEQAARDGVKGLLMDPPPVVRLVPGFGASSLDFSLFVQVRQFQDQDPVASELRKRLLGRFEKEGIEMPFPTQTVLLEKSVESAKGGNPHKP